MELRAPCIETTSNAARRHERREVGVRMGLPCHDGEVEGVVMEDDAVLVLVIRGRARYAQAHVPKRRSYHRVPRLPQGWLFFLLFLHFPSLVSANTSSLKANPQSPAMH